MDEIFTTLKTDYREKYTFLLDSLMQFLKATEKLGVDVVGQDLINSDIDSEEKKKIIQIIVNELALSSAHLLNLRNLIDRL